MASVLPVAVLLGGCGARTVATDLSDSSRSRDSGIRGRVLLGPTCPVQRAGQTCVRPYQATIFIRTAAAHRLVARIRSSATGFRVALAPGTYLLVPQNGRPYPRSSPQTATVRRHRYTNVLISYDTGIR